MKEKTKMSAEEIVKEIFYSPATNGKAEQSVKNGIRLVEEYASLKQSENQNVNLTVDKLTEILSEVLNSVKLISFFSNDDEPLQLLDYLSHGDDTIKQGKREIENICDEFYHEIENHISSKQSEWISVEDEYKKVIRELLNTYIINVDENGEPKASITEIMDLSRRTADLIQPPNNKQG